jgi:hypothetical protein
MSNLIARILLKCIRLVVVIKLMHQRLHRSHEFELISTHLCLNIVHVSSLNHRIYKERIESDVCESDVCELDVCESDVCELDVCELDISELDICESDVCEIEIFEKTNEEDNFFRHCLNDQLSSDFAFDLACHRHSSQDWMCVKNAWSMIMFFILHLKNSRIVVLIIQLDNYKEGTCDVSIIIMTSILF